MTKSSERLDTALGEIFDSYLANVHTVLPGQVTAFNGTLQTCSVQPCLQRKYEDEDEPQNLPVIEDVPVIFPGSDNLFLTYDLKVDSYVLLCFSERAIEDFLTTGGVVDPRKRRKFDLSDAVAIPGLIPTPNVLNGVDADAICLRDRLNTTKVCVATDKTITLDNAIGSLVIQPLGDVVINSGSDTAVAFSRMKIAFDTLKAEVNALITVFNAHPGHTTGAVPATPAVPAVADMSGAESPTVKVP